MSHHRKDNNKDAAQEPNFIRRTAAGDITNYTKEEVVDGLNMASNLLPKVGGPLSIGLSAASAEYAGQREERTIEKALHTRRLESMRFVPAVKEKLGDLRGRWKGGAIAASASLAGTLMAVGAAAALLGGPPGWIAGLVIGGAGAIVGGYAGGKAYRYFTGQIQDTVGIVARIGQAQSKGEGVPEEVVFAALASNLRGKDAKYAQQLLREKAHTRYFHEAVADGKIEELAEVMRDERMQRILRQQTGMPMDLSDMNKSVTAQYADYINSGRMQARQLLKPYFSPLDVAPETAPQVGRDLSIRVPSQIPSRAEVQGPSLG